MSFLVFFLVLILSFPLATARSDDRYPIDSDWADTFSTISCYCSGWETPAVPAWSEPVPEQYRSGSYFGISYFNRESGLHYNWTTIDVHNEAGRILKDRLGQHRSGWISRPTLDRRCVKYKDGNKICYMRKGRLHPARYSFGGFSRTLPRGSRAKKYMYSGSPCRKICPDVVKLSSFSEAISHRFDYKIEPICLSQEFGLCEEDDHSE